MARTEENERRLDYFRNMFDAKTEIPTRPAIPWTPEAYAGITISMTSPSSTTYNNVVFATSSTRSSQHSDQKFHLLNHAVNAAAADVIDATGHVWGVKGQGLMSIPGDHANSWTVNIGEASTGIDAALVPNMMVSIFPNAFLDAGTATRDITIEASAIPFYANWTMTPISPPTTPALPELNITMGIDGASMLGAGVATGVLCLGLF